MKRPLVIMGAIVALLVIAGSGYLLATGVSSPPEPSPPSAPPVPQPASVPQSKAPPPAQLPVQQSASVPRSKPPPPGTSPEQQAASVPQSKPPEPGPLTFEQKMERLKQTITDVYDTGESKEITLTFTEAETNTQAATRLAQMELPEDIPLKIASLHIDFQADNNLATDVRVSYGFKFTIKVESRVGVKEDRLDIEVTKVSFGFIPLPKPIKNKIFTLITERIDFNNLLIQQIEAETDSKGKVNLEFTGIAIDAGEIAVSMRVKPITQA